MTRVINYKIMEEVEKEILETFRIVEVNIPLLDEIKQIPRYAKFLKELCTNKQKLKGSERISMCRNVSALIGKSVPQIPQKCKSSVRTFVNLSFSLNLSAFASYLNFLVLIFEFVYFCAFGLAITV